MTLGSVFLTQPCAQVLPSNTHGSRSWAHCKPFTCLACSLLQLVHMVFPFSGTPFWTLCFRQTLTYPSDSAPCHFQSLSRLPQAENVLFCNFPCFCRGCGADPKNKLLTPPSLLFHTTSTALTTLHPDALLGAPGYGNSKNIERSGSVLLSSTLNTICTISMQMTDFC